MDDPPPKPPVPRSLKVVGWFLTIGFFLIIPLGMGLALTASFLKAPFWLVGVLAAAPMVTWFLGLVSLIAWVLVRAYRAGELVIPPPPGPPRPPRGVVLGGPLESTPLDPNVSLPHSLTAAEAHPLSQFGCVLLVSVIVLPIFAVIGPGMAWVALRDGGPWWAQVCPLAFGVMMVAAIVSALFKLGGTAVNAVGWMGVGALAVEASSPEWSAGGRYGLRVVRLGDGRGGALAVELVCREKVTSSDSEGTSTTERDLARYPLGITEVPAAVTFTLPSDAIPTFAEGDVRIEWRVRVSGRLWGVLRFSREYLAPTVASRVQG